MMSMENTESVEMWSMENRGGWKCINFDRFLHFKTF